MLRWIDSNTVILLLKCFRHYGVGVCVRLWNLLYIRVGFIWTGFDTMLFNVQTIQSLFLLMSQIEQPFNFTVRQFIFYLMLLLSLSLSFHLHTHLYACACVYAPKEQISLPSTSFPYLFFGRILYVLACVARMSSYRMGYTNKGIGHLLSHVCVSVPMVT